MQTVQSKVQHVFSAVESVYPNPSLKVLIFGDLYIGVLMLLIIILIFRCTTVRSPRNWKNINGKSLCRTNKGNRSSKTEFCLQATKNILVSLSIIYCNISLCLIICSNCFYLAQSTFLKLAGPQLVQVKILASCFLHGSIFLFPQLTRFFMFYLM